MIYLQLLTLECCFTVGLDQANTEELKNVQDREKIKKALMIILFFCVAIKSSAKIAGRILQFGAMVALCLRS